MKRYNEYKDSGVEWIGEIPSHWDIADFRRCVRLKQGLQIAQDKRFETDGKNRHVYITVKYTNSNKEDVDTEYIEKPYKSVMCDKDDVLLARTGATGKVITDVEGVFHNNFFKIIYDKQKITKEYLVYYLKQETIQNYLKLIAGTTTIPDLNHGVFLSTKVVLPNIIEQKQIVKYLDKKTSQIETLISKKEELIETLKASRSKLISETVTKGLDKDVPMKDSGVEWIGEIPSHWDVKKLKYITSMSYGDSLPKENRDEGSISVYGSNGIVDSNILSNTIDETVIVGRKGSYGKINYSNNSVFVIDTAYYIDKRNTKNYIKWIYYMLQILELDKNSQDTGVPGLSREYAYNINTVNPSVEEQKEIVNYLDKKTSEIDELIFKIEEQIELLKKAKQKLITEVVTGKIDVTNL